MSYNFKRGPFEIEVKGKNWEKKSIIIDYDLSEKSTFRIEYDSSTRNVKANFFKKYNPEISVNGIPENISRQSLEMWIEQFEKEGFRETNLLKEAIYFLYKKL